ncbi:MAG: hypothetical protein D6698_04930 [Gammaproteobacteria bacterium]|nr:MAG: hypothetical protein D6698_04930 [Gammaproteobacteria bacterium]
MSKTIIFIHGRDIKPAKEDLRVLWFDAVAAGLQRDFGEPGRARFEALGENRRFVYFGDLSNQFLHEHRGVDIPDECESRREALDVLKSYSREDFNRSTYEGLSHGGALKEALADTFSGVLSLLRAGSPLIAAVAPDMAYYWNQDKYFGSEIRWRLTEVLKAAFDQGQQIMLVGHSLGSIVCYDCLWKFSHYGEYRQDYGSQRLVDLFVTIGSPLGDENVKQHLKGHSCSGRLRYPHNIRRWVNLSAEDDYISHDNHLSNDYHRMSELDLLDEPVRDIHPIYNLTVRKGHSNPHSAIGYLISPEFASLLHDWLKTP